MSFVHFRAKTDNSIKEGLMNADTLIETAIKNNHKAVALTDINSLAAAVHFYTKAKNAGIKPIIGLDAWIETDITSPLLESLHQKRRDIFQENNQDIQDIQQDNVNDKSANNHNKKLHRLLFIAENEHGYKKLLKLLTKANTDNVVSVNGESYPLIKQSWIKEMGSEGLFALSGNPDVGEVPELAVQKEPKKAYFDVKTALDVYKELFPNRFFLEISRYDHKDEKLWVKRLTQLSASSGVPLIATHDVMFANRSDFFAHEVHSSITKKIPVLSPEYTASATREQFYQNDEQMKELFSDIPEALDNAERLAQKCNVSIELDNNHLPDFPIPDNEHDIESYFIKRSYEGLEKRLEQLFPDKSERDQKRPLYQERLQSEIDIITKMGFPGYFLVVSDFINWSKHNNVPIGPGRGSGAGSLVVFSLNITELDPIEHNLLFERFLNPERVSMPDIDVDIGDGRDDTINYLFDKYGQQSVSQISTVNTLAAKAALRHAGKSLNYALPRVEEIAKLVPKTPGITLRQTLEQEEKFKSFYENDKKVRRLINIALKIEGSLLTNGVHAGGVVISPTTIDDYSPMMKSEKGVMVTQYDKNDVEHAGLIKFDLLGLKTLTLLDKAKKLVNNREDRKSNPLDLNKISLNDPSSLNMLKNGDTYGVFQLESRGMTKLVKSLRPDNFEDVVALLALFRPGPLDSGMVDSFVARKHGEEKISYYHPKLEKILTPTYGVIVYQEQVMQIAQEIAGYSLGEADLLRRAMGKKKPEEMAKERVKFEAGAKKNNIDPELATELFDVMEKFAAYGFNRSHSAAYAMLSMQTAYLKANYPSEYFAAYMNVEMGNTDVLAEAVSDAKKHSIKILPPDINKGSSLFEPVNDHCVRYGMSSLKGASEKSINDIIDAREALGKFENFKDYLYKVNNYLRENGRNTPLKTVTEALICSGAFDSLNSNRAELMEALPGELDYIGKLNRRYAAQSDEKGEIMLPSLWKSLGREPVPAPVKPSRKRKKPLKEPVWPEKGSFKLWSSLDKLDHELKALGFYLSGHPYNFYKKHFKGLEACMELDKINNFNGNPYEPQLISGVVMDVFERRTKKGDKMGFMTISNSQEERKIIVFPEAYKNDKAKLKEGNFVALEVSIKEPWGNKNDSNKDTLEKDVILQKAYSKEEFEQVMLANVNVALKNEELPKLEEISKKYSDRFNNEDNIGDNGDKNNIRAISCTIFLPDKDNKHYFKSKLPQMTLSNEPSCLEELNEAFPKRVKIDYKKDFEISQPSFGKKKKFKK